MPKLHKERGLVHLLPLIFVASILVLAWLVYSGSIKLPFILVKKEPEVELQTEYKNPLSKESQYVNPFSTYKNPFDALR